MYAEYNLTSWEDRLIEKHELWLDAVSVPNRSHEPKKENKNIVSKCFYYENKNIVMEFLQSGKRAKSIDYDTAREAGYQAYRFEKVIDRYCLSAKVKQDDNRVTIVKTRLRA